jgi:hypothetical protein
VQKCSSCHAGQRRHRAIFRDTDGTTHHEHGGSQTNSEATGGPGVDGVVVVVEAIARLDATCVCHNGGTSKSSEHAEFAQQFGNFHCYPLGGCYLKTVLLFV